MIFLVFLLFFVIHSKRVNRAFLRNFGVDDGDENWEYTEEQLKPQVFEENPFEDSGYILVDQENEGYMYYVFFEAISGKVDAPIIIWLQGGPGCSSMTALFCEMGPYKVDPTTLKLVKNEFTWNEDYHMLFIDNPVGAGFSYTTKDAGYVTNEDEMATNLYTMLTKWYTSHPKYSTNDLYIFGESYAGKYVPAIGARIQKEGMLIPLKGIGIGDGLTHPIVQFGDYADFSLINSLIGYEDYNHVVFYQNLSIEAIKSEQWEQAERMWDTALSIIVEKSGGVNEYDIRTHVNYDFSDVTKYLNLPATKELMHTTGHTFSMCQAKAYEKLLGDFGKSEQHDVISLLEGDVKVLLYNGQFDFIINADTSVNGPKGWIYNMPWKYMTDYQKADRTVWKVENEWAGWLKMYKNLYTMIVGNSGHLTPMNVPVQTQTMVKSFIEGKW